jgi:predicted ATPase
MPTSNEIRRLTTKWASGTGWPQRLEWIDIWGLRGWTGQRFKMDYPIMVVVGENGAGKSTVLQCAAAVYKSTAPKSFIKGRGFASDFFPNTAWDTVQDAKITYSIRQGNKTAQGNVRKPTDRWLGNTERPDRPVVYIDLSRILPVAARVGYTRIAKTQHEEATASPFDKYRLSRLSQIMGRPFDLAKMSTANVDPKREIPVLGHHGVEYSGFHQGAGETTIAELIKTDLPPRSLVLIDEIETSLHPRSQRRLIRDLAERCRELELQIILTTHSPFILDELPQVARAHIVESPAGRTIVYGVSPEFAMTKMDDVPQYECDLYVEDKRAQAVLVELLFRHSPTLVSRCRTIPYGAASVGQALGIMVSQGRFPRPSCVFLDGDQSSSIGCVNLPGDDAPERVVFEALKAGNWLNLATRIGRDFSTVADICTQAMAIQDHHEWVKHAATNLIIAGDLLWQVMCGEWANSCLAPQEAKHITQPIEDALSEIPYAPPSQPPKAIPVPSMPGNAPTPVEMPTSPDDASETLPLFAQLRNED